MSNELDQLRDEADQRRAAIATDVELVTDRVAPGRIADRQKARFGERVSGIRASVFGTPDRRRGSAEPSTSDDSSMSARAGGALDSVKDSAPDSVADFTEGNPLAAGLIGLGVGLLAAALIPETREEQRIAREVQTNIDDAAAELSQAGQQVAENVRPAADDAVANVKGSATDSAKNVKDDATGAASDVADTAKSEADRAKPSS